MRNRCFVALGVALVVGFLVADAEARPGGKRGGRPRAASGPRAGNIGPGGQIGQGIRPGGKLQSLAGGNLQKNVSQLKTNFTPANQPFTPAWYANHPRAWQYTHPHADAWAVATFATATAWLGIAATSPGYASETTDVYTADTDDGDDNADDEQTDLYSEQGKAEGHNPKADFLPLGVFALAPHGEKDANALVQLAVNKQGVVRGNYYDVFTGQDQPVIGTLDKKNQRATFKAGTEGTVTFETTLANLTAPAGSVTLRFANGQTREWTLARFDDEAKAAESK